jgi:hypothetical protein
MQRLPASGITKDQVMFYPREAARDHLYNRIVMMTGAGRGVFADCELQQDERDTSAAAITG